MLKIRTPWIRLVSQQIAGGMESAMEEPANAIVSAFYARVMRRVCEQYRESEGADANAIALIQEVRLPAVACWRPDADVLLLLAAVEMGAAIDLLHWRPS